VLAAVIVAGIGDIRRFPGPGQLCSQSGLTPRHRESGTKVSRGHVAKQDSQMLRWAVCEAIQRQPAGTRPAAGQGRRHRPLRQGSQEHRQGRRRPRTARPGLLQHARRAHPPRQPRIRRYLGRSQVSMRTLYRRVRLVAIWRRPKRAARGDLAHDHMVAGIVARLLELPRRSVVLAEDETHLNLPAHTDSAGRRGITSAGRAALVTQGYSEVVVCLRKLRYRIGRPG
jgi:hypothetical protein